MKEIVIECPECKGTGLYKGMAERDDCAVVCSRCHGNGYYTYRYNEFTGKKIKEGVQRVFKKSCGYIQTNKNITTNEGTLIRFEDGGCTYQEWLNGIEPKPVKDLYCPYCWDNRGIGNEPIERCKQGRNDFGLISDCDFWEDKLSCWNEYEE